MNYGQRIHELRLEKDLTLRDVALASDLDSEYLGRIERGSSHPPVSPEIQDGIASALELSENDAQELAMLTLQSNGRVERETLVPLLFRTDANKKASREEILELAKYLNEVY